MTAAPARRDRGRATSPDLVLETLDWLDIFAGECPTEVDRVKRVIYGAAAQIWISRPIPGETPPPLQATRKDGTCPWCFDRLGDRRADFNGGTGHPECARYAYRALAGDDAMPWPTPEPSIYEAPAFLERLARAAAKHGLPARRLRRAIKEALA